MLPPASCALGTIHPTSRKSRLWETLTLLTDADRSTDTKTMRKTTFCRSAVVVLLKCRWRAVEGPRKCQHPQPQTLPCWLHNYGQKGWGSIQFLFDKKLVFCAYAHRGGGQVWSIPIFLLKKLMQFFFLLMSLQTNIRNTVFDKKSSQHLEVGVLGLRE